jgi:hypothetical protein
MGVPAAAGGWATVRGPAAAPLHKNALPWYLPQKDKGASVRPLSPF